MRSSGSGFWINYNHIALSTTSLQPSPLRLSQPHRSRACFNEIVRRHEALRTTFIPSQGEPRQQITPSLTIELPVIDLSAITRERETEAQRMRGLEAEQAFDLSEGPLVRASSGLDEEEHILLLVMHHIISDGWSMGVLGQRTGHALRSLLERSKTLHCLICRFNTPIMRCGRESICKAQSLSDSSPTGDGRLSGRLPVLELPTDRPRPTVQSYEERR